MADPLTPETPSTAPDRVSDGVRNRFAIAFAVLAVALVGAAIATIALAGREDTRRWSTFSPTADDPVDRATQIADYVQGRYLADDGTPLTSVTAGEDVITDLPGHEQIVSIAGRDGSVFSFEQGSMLFYKLCGPASGCTLDPATSPQQTSALTFRQGYELALRGLKDVREATAAIVLLPAGLFESTTPNTAPPTAVLYFAKDDLSDQLDRPLDRTLPGDPPRPGALTEAQANAIGDITGPALYTMNVKSAPDQTFIIYELTPPPAP